MNMIEISSTSIAEAYTVKSSTDAARFVLPSDLWAELTKFPSFNQPVWGVVSFGQDYEGIAALSYLVAEASLFSSYSVTPDAPDRVIEQAEMANALNQAQLWSIADK